ncbi:MAG TPA: hypothetical protein VFJ72_01460 [Rubrobacteraceae bacterium]|nr:hypothetical protein [Rubrobacteraceae bacterium]
MCGRSYAVRGAGFASGRRRLFGLDAEKMSPEVRVAVALSVLGPVALSGIFLVVFVPSLWWIFTTYFWVSFPALGMLGSGIAGLSKARPARVSEEDRERELLTSLARHGEVSAAAVAAETSMTVSEADRKLRELAEGGHLEVRVRGGAIFYALWEANPVESGSEIEGVR